MLITAPGAHDTPDMTGQTQAATINLGSDTAQAAEGLNAPALSFIGTPDVITLGSAADTVEYALSASSGVEAIAGFAYGTDEPNIDLAGAASATLQAYDTTVDGVAAIAIASSADPSHGIVLLDMTDGQTAANLLATHTTFSGGHAIVT